jgi:hypothetical protein
MAMMAGDTVLVKAQSAFDGVAKTSAEEGIRTYRWVAGLLNRAVLASPTMKGPEACWPKYTTS